MKFLEKRGVAVFVICLVIIAVLFRLENQFLALVILLCLIAIATLGFMISKAISSAKHQSFREGIEAGHRQAEYSKGHKCLMPISIRDLPGDKYTVRMSTVEPALGGSLYAVLGYDDPQSPVEPSYHLVIDNDHQRNPFDTVRDGNFLFLVRKESK